jgi:thiol-disulfide isomerase/thioredoxin
MRIWFIILVLSINITAQVKYKIILDEKKNLPMLIGTIDRINLQDSAFINWFDEEYEYYALDTAATDNFKSNLDNITMKIVMGTWCSDSRREVPHLFKIFDHINFPKEKYELIAIDRNKKAIDDIDSLKIELVPTIIVYKNDTEIGRIIETPKETLEKDLEQIINSHSK